MLLDCLCDEVFVDYSSFRDGPVSTLSADQYVTRRLSALRTLDTQHNFLNLRVEVDAAAGTAMARCNYIVHRLHPAYDGFNDDLFRSYGHYVFELARLGDAWRIARIAQNPMRRGGKRQVQDDSPLREPAVS